MLKSVPKQTIVYRESCRDSLRHVGDVLSAAGGSLGLSPVACCRCSALYEPSHSTEELGRHRFGLVPVSPEHPLVHISRVLHMDPVPFVFEHWPRCVDCGAVICTRPPPHAALFQGGDCFRDPDSEPVHLCGCCVERRVDVAKEQFSRRGPLPPLDEILAALRNPARETGDTCYYCEAELVTAEGAHPRRRHMDHVVPKSRGGSDDAGNLVPACQRCNASKGSQTPLEWRLANPNSCPDAGSMWHQPDSHFNLQLRGCYDAFLDRLDASRRRREDEKSRQRDAELRRERNEAAAAQRASVHQADIFAATQGFV